MQALDHLNIKNSQLYHPRNHALTPLSKEKADPTPPYSQK
jgi:hypothetical protein